MRRLLWGVLVFLPLLGSSRVYGVDFATLAKAFQDSSRYEKVENYRDAVRALLPVVQADPSLYAAHLRLGWLYYLQGKYSSSLAHYKAATRVGRGAIEPAIGSLLPLLGQEKYALVEQQAYKILTVDYFNYYANLRLSVALRKQGKLDLALEVVQRILNLYPADVAFLAQKGLILQKKGDMEKARRVFSQVLVLDAQNEIAKKFHVAEKSSTSSAIK